MDWLALLPLAVFLGLLFAGVPIAFVLMLSALLGLWLEGGLRMAVASFSVVPYSTLASSDLMVIPLFLLMGSLAFAARISENAYDTAYRWLGRLPGGLAMATIGACALFAATSGSSVATSAAVGRIAIPQMKRYGYNESLIAGSVASGGLLGIMIPPSIMFVVYGIVAEQSIGKLLLAGILPGVLTAGIFCLGIYGLARLKPEWAPRGTPFSWKERLVSVYKVWGVLALFLVVIGGIYAGVFTTSEAAGAGACAALVIALARRALKHDLLEGFADAGRTTAMIFTILLGAGLFAHFVTRTGMAGQFAEFVAGLGYHRMVTMSLLIAMYIPLGMFLDPISITLITTPVVLPAVKTLGFDPIWFGVIVVKMSELANITPPYGINAFIIKGVAPEIKLETVFRGIYLFIGLEIISLIFLVAFPQISLFIPAFLGRP